MLGPMTNKLLDHIVAEVKKEEVQNKIKAGVFDPLFSYIQARIYTYLQYLGLLIGLIILLLLVIIVLLLKYKK